MERLWFILLLLGFSVCSWAGDKDVKIVTSEGRNYFGDDTTQAQAKALALNNARRNALEEAVGVTLHGSSTLYNGDLISELVKTATKGLIVRQKILEDRCGDENGKLYCIAKIEAHVKPLDPVKNRTLKIVSASVQRPDKNTDATFFVNNDEIQIRVTANEDAFMNIFSVDQYGNILKLYPNEYQKPDVLLSRKEFVFPDNELRARGLKMRVNTPKNLSKALESVLIIATRVEAHFLEEASIQSPTITDLMKELSELDENSPWAEKTVGYEVRK